MTVSVRGDAVTVCVWVADSRVFRVGAVDVPVERVFLTYGLRDVAGGVRWCVERIAVQLCPQRGARRAVEVPAGLLPGWVFEVVSLVTPPWLTSAGTMR